jgi:serine/threonine protein kinase
MTCGVSGRTFAAKIVEKTTLLKPKAKIKFASEIRIHRSLSHPRVVEFKHYFEDEHRCYIFLELCQNQVIRISCDHVN